MVAGTGLIVGCSGSNLLPLSSESNEATDLKEIGAWLHISQEGVITYQVPSSEMGQGAMTGLTMVVAEELDADWTRMKAEFAPLNSEFNNPLWFGQLTGGSGSIMGFWEPMRELGATARAMLVKAAAMTWQVDESALTTSEGYVINGTQRLAYGDLVGVASTLNAPRKVSLKTPDEFKIIGKPMDRLDIPEKTNGKAVFGIDVTMPNLRIATAIFSPEIGGELESFDATEALKIKGVSHVIEIPGTLVDEYQPAGIAVVADSYYTALKATRAINAKWKSGPNAELSTEDIRASLISELDGMKKPDLAKYDNTVEVQYEVPFLSQSPLEPMNATAYVTANSCEIWAPTQAQTITWRRARKITGLDKDQIKLHTTYLGGGFGRRLESDYVDVAVYVSQQTGLPIKLIWSREQDMKNGYFRPSSIARFQFALGDDGNPVEWNSQLVVPDFLGRFIGDMLPISRFLPLGGIIRGSHALGVSAGDVEKEASFPYALEEFNAKVKTIRSPVPTGNYRAVAHSYTGFFAESAVDEAAHAAGKNPAEYRTQLLKLAKANGEKTDRPLNVLELVMKRSNWGSPEAGRFQGIGLSHANASFVAHVAEISVDSNKKVTVHKITSVIDCGIAVNPDLVRTQVEGSVFWSMCDVFKQEITISNGQVNQNNFYDYQTLTTQHMPEVDVYVVPSTEAPGGAGEPPIPPVAPAITNAIFAATGERLRKLPISQFGYTI